MKTPIEAIGSGSADVETLLDPGIKRFECGECGPLGHSYKVWRRLQHEQEDIIRWHDWRMLYPNLRAQNGRQHEMSFSALVHEHANLLNAAGLRLDGELLLCCAKFHDVPEGMRGIDVAAFRKKDLDDCLEYLAFEHLNKGLGEEIWEERQRAYLLQFCLKNPPCFPDDARRIMHELAASWRKEALVFKAAEKIDYLYYAVEGAVEQGVDELLWEVAKAHIPEIDKIAGEVPGYQELIWTAGVRNYFIEAIKRFDEHPVSRCGKQLLLFPA